MNKERVAAIAACGAQPAASTSALPPLTAAERVQRTRNRKKQDVLLITLEIRASERAALIRHGLLAADKARDKWATRDAIYAYLETVLDP
jgi:hypothetical protein